MSVSSLLLCWPQEEDGHISYHIVSILATRREWTCHSPHCSYLCHEMRMDMSFAAMLAARRGWTCLSPHCSDLGQEERMNMSISALFLSWPRGKDGHNILRYVSHEDRMNISILASFPFWPRGEDEHVCLRYVSQRRGSNSRPTLYLMNLTSLLSQASSRQYWCSPPLQPREVAGWLATKSENFSSEQPFPILRDIIIMGRRKLKGAFRWVRKLARKM
jgi:hypothetical protein